MMKQTKSKQSLSRDLRLRIFERDEWQCWYCGIEIEESSAFSSASIDHLLPESRGGSNEESNLVTACRSCNSKKNNRTLEEYRAYIRATLNDYGRAIEHLQASKII